MLAQFKYKEKPKYFQRVFYKKKKYFNLDLILIVTNDLNFSILSMKGVKGSQSWYLKKPFFFFDLISNYIYISYDFRHYFFKFLDKLINIITFGFSIELCFQGLGVRVSLFNNTLLIFDLGYSHICEFNLKDNYTRSLVNNYWFNCFFFQNVIVKIYENKFLIQSLNFDKISNLSSKLRSFKKNGPYQVKGILFLNEVIKIKDRKREN